MKKVGIVTFHRANNYGAVWQAYALQEYVAGKGMDCSIVDYRCAHLERQVMPTLSEIIKKKSIKSLLNFYPFRKRAIQFAAFRDSHLKMASTCDALTMGDATKDYDLLLFGSDQIWNPTLTKNDLGYFGHYIPFAEKLHTYAASFGKFVPEEAERAQYAAMLNRFQRVSLRENSGKEKFLTLTGRTDATSVADPVFLLDKKQWEGVCPRTRKREYILLYTLQGEATQLMKVALHLSKMTHLPIVEMQAWVKPKSPRVKPRFADSPQEFLGWIKDAEYVVTDSFHCTAFSVIFEKKVWSRVVETNDPKESRVGNLLFSLGLADRLLPADLSRWEYDRPVDYSIAEPLKRKIIVESKAYLDNVLRSNTEKE